MDDSNPIVTDFNRAIDIMFAIESKSQKEFLEFRILIALYWLEHFVCCLNADEQKPGLSKKVI